MYLTRSSVLRAVAGAAGAAGATALGAGAADAAAIRARAYAAPGRDPDVVLDPQPGSVVRAASFDLAASQGRAVGAGRTRLVPLTTDRFSMLAVTWRDSGERVRVRSRRAGQWSAWRELHALSDLPDPASGEGNGTQGTELAWMGPSDAVQVETLGGSPEGLRLQLIDPGELPSDRTGLVMADDAPRAAAGGPGVSRRLGDVRSRHGGPRPAIGYGWLRPPLRSRADWGAEESWRNGEVSYGRMIQQVHVHHTVSSNDYRAADVPGILRGYYRYHTGALGWNDIGYNFLVDRFGRTWVGRAGGPRRVVIGAHTLGFNEASTGVAVLGNFETAAPAPLALNAVARVAAWKLNGFPRWRPEGWATVYSHGSDDYSAGRWVRLPVIDGHRDTNDTACPGRHLYERLPYIRRRAQALVEAW